MFLVTIEGMDGAGKDTVAHLLKESLVEDGYSPSKVIIINEPSHDRFGSIVREELKDNRNEYDDITQLLMMSAARSDNILKTIIPAIENDCIVICTRSSLSAVVYQLSNIDGLHHNGLYRTLNVVDNILAINNVKEYKILLTCSLANSISRTRSRGELDYFEAMDETVLMRRRELYEVEGEEMGFVEVVNDDDLYETIKVIKEILND